MSGLSSFGRGSAYKRNPVKEAITPKSEEDPLAKVEQVESQNARTIAISREDNGPSNDHKLVEEAKEPKPGCSQLSQPKNPLRVTSIHGLRLTTEAEIAEERGT